MDTARSTSDTARGKQPRTASRKSPHIGREVHGERPERRQHRANVNVRGVEYDVQDGLRGARVANDLRGERRAQRSGPARLQPQPAHNVTWLAKKRSASGAYSTPARTSFAPSCLNRNTRPYTGAKLRKLAHRRAARMQCERRLPDASADTARGAAKTRTIRRPSRTAPQP
jgi:hypothetical protein